jgi:hypothetical protein
VRTPGVGYAADAAGKSHSGEHLRRGNGVFGRNDACAVVVGTTGLRPSAGGAGVLIAECRSRAIICPSGARTGGTLLFGVSVHIGNGVARYCRRRGAAKPARFTALLQNLFDARHWMQKVGAVLPDSPLAPNLPPQASALAHNCSRVLLVKDNVPVPRCSLDRMRMPKLPQESFTLAPAQGTPLHAVSTRSVLHR